MWLFGTRDDENHRIDERVIYQKVNLYNSNNKINFDLIHSDDVEENVQVVEANLKMWELGCGRNSMRKE